MAKIKCPRPSLVPDGVIWGFLRGEGKHYHLNHIHALVGKCNVSECLQYASPKAGAHRETSKLLLAAAAAAENHHDL